MRIICVVDKVGRIQHRRILAIQDAMKDHIVSIVALNKIKRTKFDADVIYYAHFALFNKIKKRGKLKTIASVTSHKCLDNRRKTIRALRQFDSVSVNNKILFNIFRRKIKNLHYTPNGVMSSFFSYQTPRDRPCVIGWVGNVDRAVKNYGILKPLRRSMKDVSFKIIATRKSDVSSSMKPLYDMVEYYGGIDYLLVTSDAEGTPNPALEAMSCGRPVISTRVGNMPCIINDGINGFFAENNIDSFRKVIYKAIGAENYKTICEEARKSIEKEWDWKNRSKAWVNFLTE